MRLLASPKFRRDREFLPAALEVLETPSSPTRRVLMLTLCAFLALAAAWAFVGRVGVEAVAKGKIVPTGRVKVIEPFEPGRVARIFVDDGADVRRADPLVSFDPTEAQADVDQTRQALVIALADTGRYEAALRAATGPAISQAPAAVWDETIPADVRQRALEALRADIARLRETLRNVDSQATEKRATLTRLDAQAAADEALVATLGERVAMRRTLVAHDAGTRSTLIDALQDLERAQASLAADRGAHGEAEATLGTLASSRSKALADFVAENTGKRDEAANKAAAARDTLAKAEARLGRTTLAAPVDGVVQKLAVTTVGQVVTTGQDLMIVVPSEGDLEVKAFVDNDDVGFVRPGQEVVVKLDAFPFTRYGTMRGTVRMVATDAVDEEEARRMQANQLSLAGGALNGGASGSRGQRFVFPVTIALAERVFQAGDREVPLTPGMSVTAEIKTDRQRLVDYVLSPLARIASEALHER